MDEETEAQCQAVDGVLEGPALPLAPWLFGGGGGEKAGCLQLGLPSGPALACSGLSGP